MPPDAISTKRAPNPAGLRALAPEYDGFILDLWGVLHDGFKPFPGVIDALERLIAAGKRLCILSNAPRRAADVVQRMTEIGVPPGLYHHVMSSGEETWKHLAQGPEPFSRGLGRACLHIGRPRDEACSRVSDCSRLPKSPPPISSSTPDPGGGRRTRRVTRP